MEQTSLELRTAATPRLSLVEMVSAPFRRPRLLIVSFAGLSLLLLLTVFADAPQYEAEMKILVKHDRFDPMVMPGGTAQPRPSNSVSEQEVNSEIDLLQSRELLEKVVVALELQRREPRSRWFGAADEQTRIAEGVERLRTNLEVKQPKKSHLVRVTYQDSDAKRAAQVLNRLGELYLEKHLEVHRAPGTAEFFRKEAQRHREELDETKKRLADFRRTAGVVSAEAEQASALQQLAVFEAKRQETEAGISSIRQRIGDLERQKATTPSRITTQMHTSVAPVQQLQTTLFNLEQKRTELLQKYEPTYLPVQLVEQQIESTRSAMQKAEKAPLADETTDLNPVYGWIQSELAKARTEMAAMQATKAAMARSVSEYRNAALRLASAEAQQQELLRSAKLAEEKYDFSVRKQQEARMSAALDEQRIANVAVAEAATVPSLPTSSRTSQVMMGLLFAFVLSVGLTLATDFFDPHFRTPADVEAILEVPFVAVIPRNPPQLTSGMQPKGQR